MKPVKPSLGVDTEGISIPIDVDKLVEGRLLLTATSGAGKSWALRRILEQTHGHVQHIVIDPEGEFYTLREIFDYVLARAGNEGERDCGISVQSAGLLATRLLELQVSTVVDIYDFKPAERTIFVQRFLESIMNARRNLWHPVLIVIDESHIFAPQSGESESGAAVAHLMSGGRKRGFAGCLATQRYSKLHKDASSMCQNVLIGGFTLDVDVKRAVESLGFVGRDAGTEIRALRPGQFFVHGPAFTREVRQLKVGNVQTTHPKAGQRAPMPAVPRATIRSVLEKLTDLPGEAEKQAKTEAELRAEVRKLELEVSRLQRSEKSTVDPQIVDKAMLAGYNRAWSEIRNFISKIEGPLGVSLRDINATAQALNLLKETSLSYEKATDYSAAKRVEKTTGNASNRISSQSLGESNENDFATLVSRSGPSGHKNGQPKLKRGARQLLSVSLTWYGKGLPEGEWRAKAGLRKSGAYSNNKSALRTLGLIEFAPDGKVYATEKAYLEFGDSIPPAPKTTAEVLALWNPKLKRGARQILDKLIEVNRPVSKEELSELAGLQISGAFSNNLSQLRTAGLITKQGSQIEVNRENLFL